MSKKRYELACKRCGQTWSDETKMAEVQKHFRARHDLNKVELELVEIAH
jgi:hypothetical protein